MFTVLFWQHMITGNKMDTKYIAQLGIDFDKVAKMNAFVDSQYIDTGKISGYSYLLARHGEIAVTHCSGQSAMGEEADDGHTLTPDSIFRIYSMTKPVTSLLFMQLAERGDVAFEDKLKDYIPSFANPQVWVEGTTSDFKTRPAERDITLLDLLTHQSGLTYDFLGEHPVDALYRRKQLSGSRSSNMNLADFCNHLAEMPLLFSPGTAWNYSFATDVIGRVIEIATGASLDRIMQEMIFDPLDMHDTGFQTSAKNTSRLAHCYYFDPKNRTARCVDTAENSSFLSPPTLLGGGGGLVSTLPDYYRFCQMFRQGGELDGIRIISPESIQRMQTNQLYHGEDLAGYATGAFSENGAEGNGFGIGGSVVLDPSKTANSTSKGNFSWGGLANTYFWIDPEKDLIFIFMTQIIPTGCYPLRQELSDYIYNSLVD